jgi:uncharacterized protein (DUF1697 family)
VVFTASGKDGSKPAKAIEAGIAKAFGFDVPVIVRTLDGLRAIVAANPYGRTKLAENERLFISFLDAAPPKEAAAKLEAIVDGKDELQVRKTEVYLLIRDGYGRSAFNNNFMEKKLGVRATTRNLETTQKLITLAESL